MKNKFMLSLLFLTSLSNAEYTSRFFLEDIKIKSEVTIVPEFKSTNCIFDSDSNFEGMILGAFNLGVDGSLSIGQNEKVIIYHNKIIGLETSTKNFPAGLSFGDEVIDPNFNDAGYKIYKICADDFSIYQDLYN